MSSYSRGSIRDADYCDDEPEDNCAHEEYDADILTGVATCAMCGHMWLQTDEENAAELERIAEYDEWQREQERRERWEWLASVVRTGCNAAEAHLTCSYPECKCTQTPVIVRAAIEALASPATDCLSDDPDIQFQRNHKLALARQSGWCAGYRAARSQIIEKCARIVEGDVYKEHYRKWPQISDEGNRGLDSEVTKHCFTLAAAIRALSPSPQSDAPNDR